MRVETPCPTRYKRKLEIAVRTESTVNHVCRKPIDVRKEDVVDLVIHVSYSL